MSVRHRICVGVAVALVVALVAACSSDQPMAVTESWRSSVAGSQPEAAAAAIVMDGSHSDNLHWELTEITRNGWQRRLFFLAAPAPPPHGHAVRRLVYAVQRSAKGVRIPRWEQFAAELKAAGLHVPTIEPGPGSVVAFDTAGRAEVLIRGAQQPEEVVAAVRTHL
ncbi:MAG: hypothetical protein ACRDSZ_13985 [Pseudonocardiaceae bacterium]